MINKDYIKQVIYLNEKFNRPKFNNEILYKRFTEFSVTFS